MRFVRPGGSRDIRREINTHELDGLSLAGGGLKARLLVPFDGDLILWCEQTEKLSLSGWEALADVRSKAHCVGRVSLAKRGT